MQPNDLINEYLTIPGPAGGLEALLTLPVTMSGDTPLAILSHPHPQYGGSMHDFVLDVTATTLLQRGVACLRFNFRGVGGSAGSYDGGNGEVSDILAVVEWAVESAYTNSPLWLIGYSFGAFMTWKALSAAAACGNVTMAGLIAPPVGPMAFATDAPPCPAWVVAGTNDAFLSVSALQAWSQIHLELIDGADHFFSGYSNELGNAIAAACTSAAGHDTYN